MLSTSVQNAARVVVLVSSAFAACLSSSVHSASVISLLPGGQLRQARAPADFYVFAPARSGEEAHVEQLTLRFTSATTLIRIASTNGDFTVENGGSCIEGRAFARGDTCTMHVRFTPQGAGNRLGKLTIEDTADQGTPAAFGIGGNGYAPVVSFTPAVMSTQAGSYVSGAGTISGATHLAVDGGDILYIADTGNNKLKRADSSGIIPYIIGPIATPVSLAVDSFGIVYTTNTPGSTYYFSVYFPWGSETAYGYAYTAGTCTPGAPCAFSAVGMGQPANISIDANDNLFFEEQTKGAAEMPAASVSGGSGSFYLWYLSDQFAYSSGTPKSFAADANGNIYTYYAFAPAGVCLILTESLYDAEYAPSATRVAGGLACGYSGDGGQAADAEISTSVGQIAFDLAGNMYFADQGNQRVRRVDNTTGQINTIAGIGTAGYSGDGGTATSAELSAPTGIAVNSQGAVYIISGDGASAQVVRKVGPDGMLEFGDLTTESASAPLTIDVANTGNSKLVLSNVFITGTNGADFAIDPDTTSCLLTAGSELNSGQSCRIGVIFSLALAETGSRSASLVMLDNSVASQNVVHLHGYGIAKAADRIFLGDFDP